MKVMGIDNGMRTGWSFVEDERFVDCGHIITGDSKVTNNKKIINHFNLLRSVILNNAPDKIVVETPNDTTGFNKILLSRAYYTNVIHLAYQYNIELIDCHAMTLKKAVAGSGRAEKVNVCDALVKRYNVPRERIEIPVYYTAAYKKDENGNPLVKNYLYDESDATALAYYYFVKGDM
jgi:Holliday junction resolvasome RuvABC endonuclease subunit